MSRRIDIAWMIRTARAIPGSRTWSSLSWNCGGEPAGSIGYEADMTDPYASRLYLSYTRGSGEDRESVRQEIRLVFTEPNYGGRRWWMICPYRHCRVGKLYLPNGGDRFASRRAWRLGYHSQRMAGCDRAFEALFRLQRKLGGEQGWGAGLPRRPKGMWRRTYDRHWHQYEMLSDACDSAAASLLLRLGGLGR